MKKGTTPIALIGTALLIAFGLLLMGAGIGTVVFAWHWHFGAAPTTNLVDRFLAPVLAFFSFAFGVALIALGVKCTVAGLAIGIIGFSRRGTRSRSSSWLLVGALVPTIIAVVLSASWLTVVSPNRNAAAARKAIEKLHGTVVVEGLVRRRIVEVNFDRVTDAGLKELKDLKSLQRLYLNDRPWTVGQRQSPVTDAGLKELKELKSLQSLCLNGTQITDTGLKELKDLKSLQELFLDSSQITDAGLKELKELKSLRTLCLNGTQVTDAGLKELKELKSLQSLDLENTRITDAGLMELKDLNSLQLVSLDGTQVTPAGVQELKAARPRLYIPAKVR
jgi:hypothetical protein